MKSATRCECESSRTNCDATNRYCICSGNSGNAFKIAGGIVEMQYRFVASQFVLLDSHSHLVADFIPAVLPPIK